MRAPQRRQPVQESCPSLWGKTGGEAVRGMGHSYFAPTPKPDEGRQNWNGNRASRIFKGAKGTLRAAGISARNATARGFQIGLPRRATWCTMRCIALGGRCWLRWRTVPTHLGPSWLPTDSSCPWVGHRLARETPRADRPNSRVRLSGVLSTWLSRGLRPQVANGRAGRCESYRRPLRQPYAYARFNGNVHHSCRGELANRFATLGTE